MDGLSQAKLKALVYHNVLSWGSTIVGLRENSRFIQQEIFQLTKGFTEAENTQLRDDLNESRTRRLETVAMCEQLQVELGKLKSDLVQAQAREQRVREALQGLKVTNDQLQRALQELGPTGTRWEAYIKAAVEYVMAVRHALEEASVVVFRQEPKGPDQGDRL